MRPLPIRLVLCQALPTRIWLPMNTLTTPYLESLEVPSTLSSFPITLRVKRKLPPREWNNSGLMPPMLNFIRAGSEALPEVCSLRAVSTIVRHLKTSWRKNSDKSNLLETLIWASLMLSRELTKSSVPTILLRGRTFTMLSMHQFRSLDSSHQPMFLVLTTLMAPLFGTSTSSPVSTGARTRASLTRTLLLMSWWHHLPTSRRLVRRTTSQFKCYSDTLRSPPSTTPWTVSWEPSLPTRVSISDTLLHQLLPFHLASHQW